MPEPMYPPLVMPDGVARHPVTIWSNGIALDGDIYRPVGLTAGDSVPAVVLAHGWGGSKVTGERYAALFASSGMIALTFTQSSWFGSGSPLQLIGDPPEVDQNNEATVRVRLIRDLVDPLAWSANARAALSFIEGEPNVDGSRIGLWGTSFGGGIAVAVAATDARVSALAVQVPALTIAGWPLAAHARRRAIDTARGSAPAIPQGIDVAPQMDGTPYLATIAHFEPIRLVGHLRIPTLIVDAGDEDLFATEENGRVAADTIARTPGGVVDYQVIPGITHYGVYFDGYEHSSRAALNWFGSHL